ncbi:sulfatase [Cyclobacterium jeungdonense]|uniref:Sulfatase n=1 Tax=Cyclobacterium jeungdonense TaxID=708087 RepID=A0ABT8CFE3_9BACT|nr:sulfatase [Cyclobacterium jeungdonense]MDN3690435.1 sulfatase [Cyclobacterium jeungdonense]
MLWKFYFVLVGIVLAGIPVFGQSQDRANVLFIAIDDLNDWVGALNGHPQVKTPNIDRLAKRGVLFANAHTQAPLCNPSRVSIMTGLRPETTGIYNLAPHHRDVVATQNLVTLPQYFEANGYRTLSNGKIFHSIGTTPDKKVEFQEWGPIGGGTGGHPPAKLVGETQMGNHPLLDWGVYPEEGDSVRNDYKVASWAEEKLATLKEDSSQPFFMAVGFFLPHVPLFATRKWFDLYPGDEDLYLPPAPDWDRDDVPDFSWYLHWYLPEVRLSWLKENQQWENKVRSYLATISFTDAQVGRVLDALERNGLEDNTIIVLWSDHGYHLGEKGITGKNTLWERSTHVPLIFAGKGLPEGTVSQEAVELLDIYPTLVELTGLPAKEGLEGISLLPQIRNPETSRERPAITTHNPGNHSVRSDRWRYIRYADGSEELYDHEKDPHEHHNLAEVEAFAKIKADHARWLKGTDAPHAPGSKHRKLEKKGENWYWEEKLIIKDELIK